MKTALALIPSRRCLFAATLLLTLAVAHAQTTPAAPVVPAATAPASVPRRGPRSIPSTPWFGDKALPTTDELKVLQAARATAEKDLDVRAATRTYAERFGAADDLVRTLLFKNPALSDPLYKDQLARLKNGQVLHERIWNFNQEDNRDFLLPDPQSTSSVDDCLTILLTDGTRATLTQELAPYEGALKLATNNPEMQAALEANMKSLRISYGLHYIHQAALDDKDAQIALQKVRDAYQMLEDTVRDTMKKDPTVIALVEKYPYLLYGRRDLGFQVAAAIMQG